MRNQPGVEHEKAWPQLKTTLCLRKPLHIDNSSSNDVSLRYCQKKRKQKWHTESMGMSMPDDVLQVVICIWISYAQVRSEIWAQTIVVPFWDLPRHTVQQTCPGKGCPNSSALLSGNCEQLLVCVCSQVKNPCWSTLKHDSEQWQ